MKIYTKTGDKGLTSLFDGTRVKKNNPRVDAYGSIDELNSMIGVVLSFSSDKAYEIKSRESLEKIQYDLLVIGSFLANPSIDHDQRQKDISYLRKEVVFFEETIDQLTAQLPELTNFILPGGGNAGSFLQVARTLARRAERQIVSLSQIETVDADIIIYVNRLSDFLFTLARFVNFKEGKKEIVWIKKD